MLDPEQDTIRRLREKDPHGRMSDADTKRRDNRGAAAAPLQTRAARALRASEAARRKRRFSAASPGCRQPKRFRSSPSMPACHVPRAARLISPLTRLMRGTRVFAPSPRTSGFHPKRQTKLR